MGRRFSRKASSASAPLTNNRMKQASTRFRLSSVLLRNSRMRRVRESNRRTHFHGATGTQQFVTSLRRRSFRGRHGASEEIIRVPQVVRYLWRRLRWRPGKPAGKVCHHFTAAAVRLSELPMTTRHAPWLSMWASHWASWWTVSPAWSASMPASRDVGSIKTTVNTEMLSSLIKDVAATP